MSTVSLGIGREETLTPCHPKWQTGKNWHSPFSKFIVKLKMSLISSGFFFLQGTERAKQKYRIPTRAFLCIGKQHKLHPPLPPPSHISRQVAICSFSSQSSHLIFAGKSTTNSCPSMVIHLTFCQWVKAFFPQKKTPHQHHLLLPLKILLAQHYRHTFDNCAFGKQHSSLEQSDNKSFTVLKTWLLTKNRQASTRTWR